MSIIYFFQIKFTCFPSIYFITFIFRKNENSENKVGINFSKYYSFESELFYYYALPITICFFF